MAMVDLGRPASAFDPDQFAANLKERFAALPTPEGLSFDINSLRQQTLPTVGTAVELDITVHSSRGEYAFFSYGGDMYFVFAVTGGSAKASSDSRMVQRVAARMKRKSLTEKKRIYRSRPRTNTIQ